MTNSAPNAPVLQSPLGSVTIEFAIPQRFSWIFTDPDVGDSQSQFDLQIRVVGASSWVGISGTTPNNFYDFPAGTFVAANYEWQVRTYDALGAVGPWSASSFFTAATAPTTLTITSPTSGATVNALPSLVWSTPSQTDYQIRRCRDVAGVIDTTTLYYDSGDVVSVATRSVPIPLLTNNRYEWLQIRVKNGGLWSAYVSVRVLVSYIQPSPGTVVVVANTTLAALEITTAPAAVGAGEPTPISVDIYIREVGTSGVGDRVKAGLFPSGLWIWMAPASGKQYEVRSLTTGDNGAQRWSTLVYDHIFDGGSAAAAGTVILLDGGSPTTIFAKIVDGGAP